MNKQTFITILLTALTSMSMYAYDFKKDGIYYNIEGDHVSVTNNSGSVYQGSITIPNEVTYNGVTYPVTSIAEHAFDGGRDITYLFIPRCITNIGENAFFNCGSINEVRIDYLSAWCKVYFGNEYSCPLSCAERLSFSYNPYDKVKSLFIPDDVESIPNFAFYRCRSITSLFIPSSVKKIGSSAFEECTGLTAVEMAEGVEKIGGSSFEGCTGLSTIVFPSSVKSIALNAFNKCNNLNTIVSKIKNPFSFDESAFCVYSSCKLFVPENTKSAYLSKTGWKKFANITDDPTRRSIHVATAGTLPNLISEEEKYQIEELTLTGKLNGTDLRFIREMAGVIAVGELDFDHDYVVKLDFTGGILVSLNLEGSIIVAGGEKYTLIQGYKWGECYTRLNRMPAYFLSDTKIKEIIIPNSVTSIDANAFYNSKNLISVTIPNSVTSIGEYAFWGCTGLKSITIPKNVTSIGYSAFSGCSSLTSIKVERGNSKYDSRNSCNAIIETSSNILTYGCKSTIIPNSVTSIGSSAFSGCSGLTSITIPNSVTSIGSSAFSDCSGLTSVSIPNSMASIVYRAFYNCSGLTSVSIPNSVTSIGEYAFSGCSGLTSITIPNSVISIGEYAFSSCSGLTSITLANGVKSISNYAFWKCSGLTSISIPNSVTSIGSFAFQFCSGLTSITIPNSMTSIGDYVFYGCSGLTSITIPNSVTSIGRSAFSGCSGLPSITIPNNVTSISEYAFEFCTGLKTITIPKNVTSIGHAAFSGCSSLTSIKVESENSKYDSRNSCNAIIETSSNILTHGCKNTIIPNSVTSIGSYAFLYCSGLTSITIPNSVKFISNDAFEDCSELTSINIPNSVTSIDYEAFSGCSGLTSITIPSSVTSIGNSAFRDCSGLTTIVSEIEDPFDVYSFWNQSSALLIVPKGTKTKYQAKEGWKNFKYIKEGKLMNGDFNLDDKVNFADLDALAEHIVGKNPEGFFVGVADLNDDGEVNAADVVKLADIINTSGLGTESQPSFISVNGSMVISSLSCMLTNGREEAIQLTKCELYHDGNLLSYRNFSGNSSTVAAGGSKTCSFDNLASFLSSTGFTVSWHYTVNGEAFVYRCPLTD